jgi:hypothetical protein
MPTTRVENTSGAMIILIRRRNSVVTSDSVSAKPAGSARRVLRDIAGGDAEHQPHEDISGQAVSIVHGLPSVMAARVRLHAGSGSSVLRLGGSGKIGCFVRRAD